MEAMFITRNALSCLLKSSPPQVPSLSLHKSSRVVFPSTSNYSSWRNVTEGPTRGSNAWDSIKTRVSNGYGAKYALGKGSKKREELEETIMDKTKEGTNNVVEAAENAGEKAKEITYDAKDKVTEDAEWAKEKNNENVESAKDALKNAEENAKEVADSVVDKTKHAVECTTQKIDEAGSVVTITKKVEETKDAAGGVVTITCTLINTNTNTITIGTEEAKQNPRDANERAKDVIGSMADKTKEGKDRAADTAERTGDKAKEKTKDAGESSVVTIACTLTNTNTIG